MNHKAFSPGAAHRQADAVDADRTFGYDKFSNARGRFNLKGDKISFDKVLLVDNGKDTTIGTPYIAGAKVDAEITEIGRARKILVVKYKQKSRYLRRNGHRQPFFKVKITSIK